MGVALTNSFNQQDSNGNTVLTVITPPLPAAIPPGTPAHPGSLTVLAVTTSPVLARKVVVVDTVTHQEFGDLVGVFSHGQTSVVLNNHSFFTNVNDLTESFVYDDTGEEDPEFPGARRTDGPGSLTGFIGATGSDGVWTLSMVNDSSPSDTGTFNRPERGDRAADGDQRGDAGDSGEELVLRFCGRAGGGDEPADHRGADEHEPGGGGFVCAERGAADAGGV